MVLEHSGLAARWFGMRWSAALSSLLVVVVLLPSAAQANIEGRRVERAGSGEVPHDADQLTYRIDFAWQHEPVERSERTVRCSEIIRRAGGDVVASIPVRCEVPAAARSIERCSSTTVGARALRRLGFAPIAEASMSGDLQTVRVDNLRISRWIQQHGRASDIIVEPALARVLAAQSDDEPAAAIHLAAASPVAAAKCTATDTRRATSHDPCPRTGDALAVLALLVLLVLGDIVLWRRGLVQPHAR